MPQPTLSFFRNAVALGFALLLLGATGARAQNLTGNFVSMEPLAGDNTTTALCLSPDGTLVAGQTTTLNGVARPFTWYWQDGGSVTVFTNTGNATGNATSILPTGVTNGTLTSGNSTQLYVVGNCIFNGSQVPFVYNGTGLIPLTLTGNNSGGRAVGVADVNTRAIAVNQFGGGSSNLTSYAYDVDGTGSSSLGVPSNAAVYGVSADGVNYPYFDPSTGVVAVYNFSSGTSLLAPALAGNFTYTNINAISTSGAYVVGVATGNATAGKNVREGFLFTKGNTTSTLLVPFKLTDAFATCQTIADNAVGLPIGGGASGASSNFADERAVLFDTALGATLDLKQLLVDLYGMGPVLDNTTVGHWTLNEVHSISADGKVITGDGFYFANATATGIRKGFVVSLDKLPEEAQSLTIVAQPTDANATILTNATFVVAAVPEAVAQSSTNGTWAT